MDDELVVAYRLFRDECIRFQDLYDIYSAFDPEVLRKNIDISFVVNKSAPIFFSMIFEVCHQHIRLQVSRLTDPPGEGSKTNLSIQYLDRLLENSGKMTKEIRTLSERIHFYVKPTREARRKYIAHADKDIILNKVDVGFQDVEEWNVLVESIYKYVKEVGSILDDVIDYRMPNDVADLINFIRAGIAFHGGGRHFFSEEFYKWIEGKHIGEQFLQEWISIKHLKK